MLLDEEDRLIGAAVERLVNRFPGIPAATVQEVLGSVRRGFDGAPIRDFVPLFVERKTKEHLESIVAADAPPLETAV